MHMYMLLHQQKYNPTNTYQYLHLIHHNNLYTINSKIPLDPKQLPTNEMTMSCSITSKATKV